MKMDCFLTYCLGSKFQEQQCEKFLQTAQV